MACHAAQYVTIFSLLPACIDLHFAIVLRHLGAFLVHRSFTFDA